MGGVAQLARALGHEVSGQDANVYPPMSDQLQAAGITLQEGYSAAGVPPEADVVVIGNALSRGNPAVEAVLDRGMRYTSGAQWLADELLPGRWVLAVAGTHGKTSTSAMLAWILEYAGMRPGFLIGGVPRNFGHSARLGESPFFVVEADEYDTAFFDKRSKFVHYHPRTAVLNNLEFDHADIFPDLAAIERQFHHFVRTIPGQGLIIRGAAEPALDRVMAMGCWTPVERVGEAEGWCACNVDDAGSCFEVHFQGHYQGTVEWSQLGAHNVANALAAIAAARHAGVPVGHACAALAEFGGVKRRLEVRGEVRGITVYDDFAHHPTAIEVTLAALRGRVGEGRILAVVEPRSNTMRMGVHRDQLAPALVAADRAFLYAPANLPWDTAGLAAGLGERGEIHRELDSLLEAITAQARPGDAILVMSNGAFGGIHQRLLQALAQ